jgi:hypothetical protein
MSAIREENSNEIVRCPKPKLIVADKTAFLNELKGCKSSLFCIATKKETLEALETIANKNEAEVWRYSLTDVENSRKDFNWIKLCNDERMASLLANTILNSKRYNLSEISYKIFFLQKAFGDIAKRDDGNPLLAYNEKNVIKPKAIPRTGQMNGGQFTYYVWRFPVFAPCVGLDWLVEEPFRKFTVENGSQSPDFSKLRNNNKVIAYLDLTELEGQDTTPLSSLFFTIALEQLKQSDNTNTAYIFIDELTNIGQIPSLPMDIGLIRHFNIGLVLATSDLDKLAMIYGLDNARLIIGNGFEGFRRLMGDTFN